MAERFADAAAEALRRFAGAAPGAADGSVESIVVRVAHPDGAALVTVERTADGVRASCSCGFRPCSHVGTAIDALAARVSDSPAPAVRLSIPPGPPPSTPPAAGASPVPPADAELASQLGALLGALAQDGIASGSERAERVLEDLVAVLHGTDRYGLHRSLADLRREIGTTNPSPDRVLRALEVLAATGRLLDVAAREGRAGVDRGAWGLLVGHDLSLAEMEVRERVVLLEVARNSARTPFGYRRVETFLVEVATGVRYAELFPAPLDGAGPGEPERYGGSVGPFPRLVRADLAAVEPGPSPQRIRLLQYRIEQPVPDEHFSRLRENAADDVATLYAEYSRLAEAVGCSYPCLAVFAPRRVVWRDGEAALLDGDDRILPLARSVAPEVCAAADRFLARGRPEVVVGHLLLVGRTLVLSPLSVLMELSSGERLMRLR